jgi:hypothetical protein
VAGLPHDGDLGGPIQKRLVEPERPSASHAVIGLRRSGSDVVLTFPFFSASHSFENPGHQPTPISIQPAQLTGAAN